MTPQAIELEASTLRTCCELTAKHGAMTIVDLFAMIKRPEAGIRKAVAIGIELGYLVEGAKCRVTPTRGNLRKTYARTDKPLPGVVVIEQPEPVISLNAADAPFRHWMDSALFGEPVCAVTKPLAGRVVSRKTVDDQMEAA